MRLRSVRYALLSLFATLTLAACQGKDDPSQPGGSTPEAAVQTSIDLFQSGNFNGLWRHALPPADYATLRADWGRHSQGQLPITAEDRAHFNETLQLLTGPDAENKLYAELQPKLAAMETQYKDQIPVLISVGAALAKNAVTQNKSLSTEQKTQAGAALDVLAPWAQQAPWFDQARAKQSVGIAVTAARKLDLKSPEQLRSMDFDTAMGKYSIGYGALKQVLAIYGLSVDDTLSSVKLTPIDNSHGHARVKVDYTLLGKPLSSQSSQVLVDGRWYSEDMINNVRQAHQQLSEPARAASSTAASSSSVSGPVAASSSVPTGAASTPAKD